MRARFAIGMGVIALSLIMRGEANQFVKAGDSGETVLQHSPLDEVQQMEDILMGMDSSYLECSEIAIEQSFVLLEKYGDQPMEPLVPFPDEYGGHYINSEGQLVIQKVSSNHASGDWLDEALHEIEVQTSESRTVYGHTPDDKKGTIHIETVNYSYSDLNQSMVEINRYFSGEISDPMAAIFSGAHVHEPTNSVVISLYDVSSDAIELFKTEVIDAPFLRFESVDERPQNMAVVHPGSRIKSKVDTTGSVGYRATRNGRKGFVTAGHIAKTTDSLRSGISLLLGLTELEFGKTVVRQNSGNLDAAFVEITNSSHIVSNTVGNSTLSTITKTPPPGTAVMKKGSSTGITSGRVESINASKMFSDGLFTDLISTSVSGAGGDSGGVLFTQQSYGGAQYTSGILKGGSSYSSYYTKATSINSTFNLSRY